MGNPLDSNTHKGTLGELLVQIRLLTLNIESFPPLKDSGTDLVAYMGKSFKSIQVKTRKDGNSWKVPDQLKIYDILALVDLNKDLLLDQSEVFLLTKKEAEGNAQKIASCTLDKEFNSKFGFSERRVRELCSIG